MTSKTTAQAVIHPPTLTVNGKPVTTITDSAGRSLGIVEMGPVEQLNLFEACGSLSSNSAWVGLALLACSVVTIDGAPVFMPKNPNEVKTLAGKLDTHGVAAVAKFLGEKNDEAANDEALATAKN